MRERIDTGGRNVRVVQQVEFGIEAGDALPDRRKCAAALRNAEPQIVLERGVVSKSADGSRPSFQPD
jgi:hypothetical protein